MPRKKSRGDLRWLLEPPEPGQVHLHLEIGEGTELSPEATEAVEALMRALSEVEVSGYACSPFTCPKQTHAPCAMLLNCPKGYSCRICSEVTSKIIAS
jgi:hypothetical protein